MSVNQIPTLILGIGGVGCKIAAAISDSLSDTDRKYVGVIGIDTNVNDLALLKDKHKMETIQTSEPIEVMDYLEKHPEYADWFPDNRFLRERTMTDGAGQIRTLSRMACLSAIENGRFSVLLSELNRIRRVDENQMSSRLTVMFVGSITGGTGAGLFLQLPFYVRDLIKKQSGIKHFVVRGMFIGPDVMEEVQPSSTNRDAICVNGYTCLKELNAFYMRSCRGDEMADNLRLEYFDHTDHSPKNVPYDYLYLMEKSNNHGSAGDVKVEEVINYAAHIVFTLLFSPVNGDTLSLEDNLIMESIKKGGMNKYTGAGMCRLVYPQEIVQNYVTMSVVKTLVKNEWLLIDEIFESRKRAAMDRQRTDSSAELPKLKTAYVEIFEEETKGSHPKLGKLSSEAYIKTDKITKKRTEEFKDIFEEIIKDQAKSFKENIKLNENQMTSFDEARSEAVSISRKLSDYEKKAKKLIASAPPTLADRMFPQSVKVMDSQKDKPECIYSLLTGVHPVTARFLIYDFINELEKIADESKQKIAGTALDYYEKVDFYPLTKSDKENAETAITRIEESQNGLWKLFNKIPALALEENSLSNIKKQMNSAISKQVGNIERYLEASLKYNVASILLERLNLLADNYAVFFSTIAAKIENNNEKLTRMENIQFPFGKDGVYCSREALYKIADTYMAHNAIDLPKETKQAIFDRVFEVQSKTFASLGSRETQAEREMRSKRAQQDLERIFETAVVETIHNDVVKNGAGIVNLNIRSALLKEYEMKTGAMPSDADYDKGASDYIKNRIETAMRIAEPMITTEVVPEMAEICFMALSPACAETNDSLVPDVARTKHFYLPGSDTKVNVMIHEEFPDTEITCVRVFYGFMIEQLIKYKKGSRNEKAYRDRILNLGLGQMSIRNGGELITVNPHLNCFWHEEGFLPDIDPKQWDKDKMDVLKAFIYALGMDSFTLLNDDEHPDDNGNPRPTWYYNNAHIIKKCGKVIGNGFSDVYDSLLYNGMIKLSILNEAKAQIEQMKGYRTSEELFEEILSNRFVNDLIQPAERNLFGNGNIFDIFLIMRSHMPEKDWKRLFEGLIQTLWEFCDYLFDNSEVYVNKATKLILENIYAQCSVSKKSPEEKGFADRMLDGQYEALLKRKFEMKR